MANFILIEPSKNPNFMKNNLLRTVFAAFVLFAALSSQAQNRRYIDRVFADVTKTSNIMYDSNWAMNLLYGAQGLPTQYTSSPVYMSQQKCDIYQPTGDTAAKRPLIILAHTGSYLPPIMNKQTTGSKDDSNIVYMATELARRGYVVMAVNYRVGWRATSTDQQTATEDLIKATYRAMQDVRCAVRFMNTNASTYKIDTSKVIVGGQGTGGYVALAIATVSNRGDLENNFKFRRNNLTPMVNMDTLGDWTGVGGYPYGYNVPKNPTVNSNIHMVFNFGGAMGDTAWMKPNSLPMVPMQCTKDVFAPYHTGNVIVPTTGVTVIPNASGAGDIAPKANQMGINAKLNRYHVFSGFDDRARMVQGSTNNMFGFESAFPYEVSPWEYWDRTSMKATQVAMYRGLPIPASGNLADSLSLLTNPFMSAPRAKAYCDTIIGYVTERIAIQFDLANAPAAFDVTSANNQRVVVKAGDMTTWSAAWTASTGNIMGYQVLFTKPNMNFDNAISMLADNNGQATTFTITKDSIDKMLTMLQVAKGDSVDMVWSVGVRDALIGRLANQILNIRFIRGNNTGVEELNNNWIAMYPNPSNGIVHIENARSNDAIASVMVFDITGKLLMQETSSTMDVSALSAGTYLVRVTSHSGAQITRKLVKE